MRYAILLASVLGLISWFLVALRYRRLWYVIPPALWLINVSVFHVMRLTAFVDIGTLNFWALSIQLQGALTLFGIGWFLGVTKR